MSNSWIKTSCTAAVIALAISFSSVAPAEARPLWEHSVVESVRDFADKPISLVNSLWSRLADVFANAGAIISDDG